MVFNANTESKTEYTIWKNIKNWAENWYQIVCGILFDLIHSMTSSVSINVGELETSSCVYNLHILM